MVQTIGAPNVVPRPTAVETAALEEAARYFRRAGSHTAAVIQLAACDPNVLNHLTQLSQALLATAALCDDMRLQGTTAHPLPEATSEPG